jgi:hypothetical protein
MGKVLTKEFGHKKITMAIYNLHSLKLTPAVNGKRRFLQFELLCARK